MKYSFNCCLKKIELLEFHDQDFVDKLFDIRFNEKGFILFHFIVIFFIKMFILKNVKKMKLIQNKKNLD